MKKIKGLYPAIQIFERFCQIIEAELLDVPKEVQVNCNKKVFESILWSREDPFSGLVQTVPPFQQKILQFRRKL